MTALLADAPSGQAGPLGLLVVLLIGVALVLLIRNMNGRLRRLPPSFDEPSPPPPSTDEDEPTP
jgi:hypothetical protein